MNASGVYLVSGRRVFRGHKPGVTFEATFDAAAERRGLLRGDITLLERTTPAIQPGSLTLPPGWLNQQEEVQ